MIIKPSGVDYEKMKPEDMVVVDLISGETVEGQYKPSSDTATHIELYKAFPSIGGITHTHSINVVAFAQAGFDIPALGTTHADYFYGAIPCMRELTKAEVEEAYEVNTGKVVVECIKERGVDPLAVPGVVVKNHGPFSWGKDAAVSVYHTFILSFSYILSSAAVWPFIRKHIDFVKPTWEGIKRHIKPNLVLFWPVIAVSLYNIMDKIMLGWFSTDEEVAFYTYAERIITISTTLILALDNVIMPRMSNLYASEGKNEKIKYLMDNVMLFAMFMAAAMGFGLAGVSDVFAPWFYGSAFTRCGYFILLLSPVIIFKGWAGALRTQFIIPTGRDKIYVVSLTTGAIVNLILNALFIPSMNGVGAIIGTIAAEFDVCFIQFFWCRKDIDIKNYLINGFSFCIIGAIMFFVVEAPSHVSSSLLITMVVQVLCGAAVYIVLGCFFMVKIRKNPVLVNEGLKMLRIRYRFK